MSRPFVFALIAACTIVALHAGSLQAQKFLQLERTGSLKVERFAIGEQFRFKLPDDDAGWYERYIEDLNPEGQLIMLGNGWYGTKDISAVWYYRKRVWPNVVGIALQAGGASMILGDLYNTIRGEGYRTENGWEFGLINIAVGTGLRAALSPIRHKLSDRKRLRVVDLTF
jgi:hypothetical protein